MLVTFFALPSIQSPACSKKPSFPFDTNTNSGKTTTNNRPLAQLRKILSSNRLPSHRKHPSQSQRPSILLHSLPNRLTNLMGVSGRNNLTPCNLLGRLITILVLQLSPLLQFPVRAITIPLLLLHLRALALPDQLRPYLLQLRHNLSTQGKVFEKEIVVPVDPDNADAAGKNVVGRRRLGCLCRLLECPFWGASGAWRGRCRWRSGWLLLALCSSVD